MSMSSRPAVLQARDRVAARLLGQHRHPAVAGVGLTVRDGVQVVQVLVYGDQRDATDEVVTLAEHEPIAIDYLPDGARIVARSSGIIAVGGVWGYGLDEVLDREGRT